MMVSLFMECVLCLTRVEANIDLKILGSRVLQEHLQEQGMSGASTTTPSNNRLLREFKDEGTKKCALESSMKT